MPIVHVYVRGELCHTVPITTKALFEDFARGLEVEVASAAA